MFAQQPQQLGQLPVPVDQPTNNGLWSQNPYNDPNIPMPPIPIAPQFGWVIPTAVGSLVKALQDSCRAGPVSTFAYNLFSSNAYRNELFQIISVECIEYVVYRLRNSGNTDVQGETIKAATEYARVATAACAQRFPALLNYCPPVAQNDIRNVLTMWQSVKAAMQGGQQPNMLVQQHQQPAGLAGAYNQMPHTGGGHGMFAAGHAMVAASQDDRGRGTYQRELPVADALVEDKPVQTSRQVEPERPVVQAQLINELPLSDGLPEPDFVFEGEDDELVDIHQIDFDAPQTEPFANGTVDLDQIDDSVDAGYPSKDGWPLGRCIARSPSAYETHSLSTDIVSDPKNPWIQQHIEQVRKEPDFALNVVQFLGPVDRPWDAFIAEVPNDQNARYLLVPVLKQTLRATRDAHQPNRELPYNPETHVLFHARRLGSMEPAFEYICAVEDSMKYLYHEFDEELRQKEAARTMDRDNIKFDETRLFLIEPRAAKQDLDEEVKALEKAQERYVRNPDPNKVHVRAKAIVIPKCIPDTTLDQTLQRIDEYRNATIDATPALDGEDLVDIYEAYGTHSLKYQVLTSRVKITDDLLKAYRPKPGAPELALFLQEYARLVGKDRFYNRLNDILTGRVNTVLYHSMGITNMVIEDYAGDYSEILDILKDYGPAQLNAFNKLVDNTVAQLQFTLNAGVLEISTQYSAVFIDRSFRAMGFFPFTPEKTDGAISVTTHPSLYLAMDAVLKRTAVMNGKIGAPVYIISSDDRVIQIHRSAWDKHYISVQLLSDRSFQ